MGADWTILPVLAVIFLATLIRSAFGFGEALVAVPLLALFISAKVAVPLATLVSITVAGIVVAQDWHKIHVRSAGWLVFSTLFGIPLGLWLLAAVAEPVVKAILACVIIGFSSYCLLSRNQYELKNDRLAWIFGFGAGVLGGAYGMNGPPLVIYGSLRHWSPEQFGPRCKAISCLPVCSACAATGWTACGRRPSLTTISGLCLPPWQRYSSAGRSTDA